MRVWAGSIRRASAALGAVALVAGCAAASATTGSLPYSRASGHVIQPQPSPGQCHAQGQGTTAEPDPNCTPGARNPQVTPATLAVTICRSGWTKTVRPSASITGAEKRASMVAYGDRGSPSAFEYDHLVSLELGGAVNDARNLWPEPGASPNRKDRLEGRLRRLICAHRLSLGAAQQAIARDWVAAYRRFVG